MEISTSATSYIPKIQANFDKFCKNQLAKLLYVIDIKNCEDQIEVLKYVITIDGKRRYV